MIRKFKCDKNKFYLLINNKIIINLPNLTFKIFSAFV